MFKFKRRNLLETSEIFYHASWTWKYKLCSVKGNLVRYVLQVTATYLNYIHMMRRELSKC